MPNYQYKAMNVSARTIRGSMLADNEIDLETRLSELGLDLISCKEEKKRVVGGTRGGVKLKDMLVFCLHLEQLSRAGVPIHEGLVDVRESTESLVLRDVVTDVLEGVKSGKRLSEAMAAHPNVFETVFIGLIEAGEKNGNLTDSFAYMSDHLKWTNELRRKIKKAVNYPIVMVVVLSAVITIMMLFVVPKMIDFIQNQGFDIPLHTRALIATSAAFEQYWYIILGTPVLLIMLSKILYRLHEPYAFKVDALVMRLPVIGNVARRINLARFVHFFSVMFKSGIDIPEALIASRNVVGNRVIKESIDLVHKSVTEGNSLTDSLRISNQFPNLVIRMFKIGEDSGNMHESLSNVTFFYNREVEDSVDGMVSMIQPMLTVVMGGIIFWVIAAVFGPLYQSFQNMNF
jgi:type IV pilus assembly protein PilC